MALKAAFLFFGTILISLQFCHVSCDSGIEVNVDANTGRLSFKCSRTYYHIKEINDYKCKFQLSNGIFIEYKSKNNDEKENVNASVKYQITHPASTEVKVGRKICKIEVDPPLEKLNQSDIWKCWIITREETFGYHLKNFYYQSSTEKLKPNISSSAVFTKMGDTFMAGCQVMHPIDYCYLVSPNGTQFAVTTSEVVPNYPGTEIQLEYYQNDKENYNKRIYSSQNIVRTLKPSENSNFAMGDCFGLIKNAVKTNEGNWTCQLHLADSHDSMALNFTVNVTESYLIPAHTEGSSPKTLSCNALPTFPSKVNGCRWSFPNSTMISHDSPLNVTLTNNATSCMITFNEWKGEWHDEKWICVVQFVNDFGDKFHASTTVSSSTMSLPMLISVVLLTIFSLLHYVYTC